MKKNTRTIILSLFCGGVVLPLGCGAQTQSETVPDLNLEIDNTPLDREDQAPVNSYSGVLKDIQPTVVSVYSQRMVDGEGEFDHPSLRRFFREEEMPRERMERGIGSGVIVSRDGYVLTNYHVVQDAERIIIQFSNDGHVEADVVGTDAPTDIAVLRINGDRGREYPFAVLADSDLVEVGDVVFALGNALGIGHAVTSGIVSARGRTAVGILGEEGYEDFLQTDASMNIGNSGGPLVDSLGRVIGVNTAIASPGGGNVGIGFAIPINMARDVMQDLIEFGEVRRGYLGISLRDAHPGLPTEFGAPDRDELLEDLPDYQGALIVNVVAGSPADQAGLREGDIVVEMDGETVSSARGLRLEVARKQPASTIELGVMRNDERMTVVATLGSRDEAETVQREEEIESEEFLPGVKAASITSELRQQLGLPDGLDGLLVTEVDQESPHGDLFPPGGIVIQVNGEPVYEVEEARELIEPGRNLVLVFHEGALLQVVVEINAR